MLKEKNCQATILGLAKTCFKIKLKKDNFRQNARKRKTFNLIAFTIMSKYIKYLVIKLMEHIQGLPRKCNKTKIIT